MVNVQNAADKFNANEGRLFVAKGHYEISVTWTSAKQMVITCKDVNVGTSFARSRLTGIST